MQSLREACVWVSGGEVLGRFDLSPRQPRLEGGTSARPKHRSFRRCSERSQLLLRAKGGELLRFRWSVLDGLLCKYLWQLQRREVRNPTCKLSTRTGLLASVARCRQRGDPRACCPSELTQKAPWLCSLRTLPKLRKNGISLHRAQSAEACSHNGPPCRMHRIHQDVAPL